MTGITVVKFCRIDTTEMIRFCFDWRCIVRAPSPAHRQPSDWPVWAWVSQVLKPVRVEPVSSSPTVRLHLYLQVFKTFTYLFNTRVYITQETLTMDSTGIRANISSHQLIRNEDFDRLSRMAHPDGSTPGISGNSSISSSQSKLDGKEIPSSGTSTSDEPRQLSTGRRMTTRQIFTVVILCFINLINYMDRMTIAGEFRVIIIESNKSR